MHGVEDYPLNHLCIKIYPSILYFVVYYIEVYLLSHLVSNGNISTQFMICQL